VTRRLGPYAPLSATYAQDDAILRAGPDAELLFVRGMAWCGQSHSDGWMSDDQVDAYVAARLTNVPERIEALVREGLWLPERGGYQIKAWLKWNRSEEEIEAVRAADRDRKKTTTGGPPKPPPSRTKKPAAAKPAARPEPVPQRDDIDQVLRKTAVQLQSTAAVLARHKREIAAALDAGWPAEVLAGHLGADPPEDLRRPVALLKHRLAELPKGPADCDCLGCAGWRAAADAADRQQRQAVEDAEAEARAAQEAAAWAARQDAEDKAAAERDARVDEITEKIGADLADALIAGQMGPKVRPIGRPRSLLLAEIYAAVDWDPDEIRARAIASTTNWEIA